MIPLVVIGGSVYIVSVVSAAAYGALRGAWAAGTEAHQKAVQSISEAQERASKSKEC